MPESGEKRGPLQKRWLVLGGLILLAGIFLIPFIQEGGARVDTSVEVETEPAVTGSIRETAEGAGVVVNAASVTVNAVYGGQFAEVAVENGDLVEPGDLLARYDTEELETQIEALLTELDDLDEQIGQSDQGLTYEIQAEVGGLVKTVNARRGGVTGEGPLVVLSADGLLRVGFVPAEGTALPEDGVVVVRMDEREEAGTIVDADEETGVVTVTFPDNGDDAPGAEAVIYDPEGNELGRGNAEINDPYEVTAEAEDNSSRVLVAPGDQVAAGDSLLACIDATLNEEYQALLDLRGQKVEELYALQEFKEDPVLTAENRGVVAGLEAQPGDGIVSGQKLCRLVSTETFTVRVDIPEELADRVEPGQTVELAFAAGTFTGEVELVNRHPQFKYGQKVCGVAVQTENAEGLQIGMEAQATIILAFADDAVLVPLRAVEQHEDGTETVVLFYGDGLTRTQTVETGLRDGTYVQILRGVDSGENVVVASHVVETTVYSFFNLEWVIGQEEGPSEDGLVSETDTEQNTN